MKNTRYFSDYQSAYNYYGGNVVPSTEIALVGDGSYVFVSSDNALNNQYFDASMTNDEIVDNMVTTAYSSGVSYGEAVTYPVAYAAGTAYGETIGYTAGHTAGYSEGYSYGYSYGYTEGEASVPAGPIPYEEQYFTIEITEVNSLPSVRAYNAISGFEYSVNGGVWTSLDAQGGQTVSLIDEPEVGDKIRFRGNSNTALCVISDDGEQHNLQFSLNNVKWIVYGNIMSLVKGDNFVNTTLSSLTNSNYAFAKLFDNVNDQCLTSAENLIFPSDTSNACYSSMFKNYKALVKAPKLPATTLAEWCYAEMFSGCTSLIEMPKLLATTLADYCYSEMFSGCTALVKVHGLPATTLATSCYYEMFKNCTSLVYTPNILGQYDPTTDSSTHYAMFEGCTSLVGINRVDFYPNYGDDDPTSDCFVNYSAMFNGCTSLQYVFSDYTDVTLAWPSTRPMLVFPLYDNEWFGYKLVSGDWTRVPYVNYMSFDSWPSSAYNDIDFNFIEYILRSAFSNGFPEINQGGEIIPLQE